MSWACSKCFSFVFKLVYNCENVNLAKYQMLVGCVKWNDPLGYIYKHKAPIVIRYHYVSKEKESERFSHRILNTSCVPYMTHRRDTETRFNEDCILNIKTASREIQAKFVDDKMYYNMICSLNLQQSLIQRYLQ